VKRIVRMGASRLDVSLKRDGDTLEAVVDGRSYRLSVREAQNGVFSFIRPEGGGPCIEAIVLGSQGGYRIRVRRNRFDAMVERPGENVAGLSRNESGGPLVLKAVMPGRVVRVLVSAGDDVERGQGIVVIEAMKMENEMGAPREGTVRKVSVAAGDRVERGAELAVIE